MIKKLLTIQKELKAPKNQINKFGGFNYRSAEDILEAVKPLLAKEGLTLTISDEVENIGERYYIKATAKLSDGTNEIKATAYAREAETKKGMDDAQITGSASSYARKYALNGLFLIDDTKDADFYDNKDSDKDNNKVATPLKENRIDKMKATLNKVEKRTRIKNFLDGQVKDLKTKEDYEEACNNLLGIELKEENYDRIIETIK